MEQVITVDGMRCGHCKQAVEGAVSALAGVAMAQVDLEAKTLTVEFDDTQVALDAIKEAVEDQGFDVVG